MSAVKLPVKRFTAGSSYIGDVVGIYDIDEHLGVDVENFGGAYSILEVHNVSINDTELQKLVQPFLVLNPDWIAADVTSEQFLHSEKYDRKYYLNPVTPEDPEFAILLETGRLEIDWDVLKMYIMERTDA